jgi:hypothetical protein
MVMDCVRAHTIERRACEETAAKKGLRCLARVLLSTRGGQRVAPDRPLALE